jgi:hypothetical protein
LTALPYIDILPSFDAVRVVNIRVTTDNHILIVCEPARPNVACPKCARLSQKIHSKRLRTLHDLPFFGRPVELLLSCRCFRCENPDCECKFLLSSFQVYLSDTVGGPAGLKIVWLLWVWSVAAKLLSDSVRLLGCFGVLTVSFGRLEGSRDQRYPPI